MIVAMVIVIQAIAKKKKKNYGTFKEDMIVAVVIHAI